MYRFMALCGCLCASLTFANLQEGQVENTPAPHMAMVRGILPDQDVAISEALVPLLMPLTEDEAEAQLKRLCPALQLCTKPEEAYTILHSYQQWMDNEGADIQPDSDADPLKNLEGQVKKWVDPAEEFRLGLGFFDDLDE